MVSVIIPCYNSQLYIEQSFESALAQKVSREIIIIDDKSKDGSVRCVTDYIKENYNIEMYDNNSDAYARRFSNLKMLFCARLKEKRLGYATDDVEGNAKAASDFLPCNVYILSNTKNRGAAYSRNKGVRVARGEYVAFLDADDWWAEDKLAKQLAIMEESGSFLCTTDRELVLSKGVPSGAVVRSPAYITFKKLLKSNWINCSAVLVKREALAGFPMKPGKLHEDYLCWLNIVRDYGPAVNVTEPLLKYRVRLKSKSGNKFRSMKLSFNTYRSFGYGYIKSILLVLRNVEFGIIKFCGSLFKKKH